MFNEEEKNIRKPDFSSYKGVSVWSNQGKDGEVYLTISIPLLNISVTCFKTKEAENE